MKPFLALTLALLFTFSVGKTFASSCADLSGDYSGLFEMKITQSGCSELQVASVVPASSGESDYICDGKIRPSPDFVQLEGSQMTYSCEIGSAEAVITTHDSALPNERVEDHYSVNSQGNLVYETKIFDSGAQSYDRTSIFSRR